MKKINLTNIERRTKKLKFQQEASKSSNFILQLFLSLDIDMQALKDVKDKGNYLEEMFSDAKGNGSFYKNKLEDCHTKAEYLKGLISSGNDISTLLTLLGMGNKKKSCIYKFLDKLDKMKNGKLEKDVEILLCYFKKCYNEELFKNIDSFNDWYCALAGELRKLT